MYITAGIGSSGLLERFTADYDLPNDTAYAETCASIGLANFGERMARITKDAQYMEIVERALYNTVRAGISITGDRYFYVNPLEVWPAICISRTSREHVKPVRQKWYDVACCPPNVARTFTSLGKYIYFQSDSELYVNMFIQNEAELEISGEKVSIKMGTDYPRTGNIKLALQAPGVEFALCLRVPSFAGNYSVSVKGVPVEFNVKNGYMHINRTWENDTVEISFEILPRLIFSNPLVRANTGKMAILRGPEVYCLEETDNFDNLSAVYVSAGTDFTEEWDEDLLGGTVKIKFGGYKLTAPGVVESYINERPGKEAVSLTAIPYGSWGNRQEGEMIVWMNGII
jgi:hypothetical protein